MKYRKTVFGLGGDKEIELEREREREREREKLLQKTPGRCAAYSEVRDSIYMKQSILHDNSPENSRFGSKIVQKVEKSRFGSKVVKKAKKSRFGSKWAKMGQNEPK